MGNYKVGFPQWRVMKCTFPEGGGGGAGGGAPVLRMGDEVFVLGRSQKRGYLVIEYNGQQMHLPHNYTELRVSGVQLTVTFCHDIIIWLSDWSITQCLQLLF